MRKAFPLLLLLLLAVVSSNLGRLEMVRFQ